MRRRNQNKRHFNLIIDSSRYNNDERRHGDKTSKLIRIKKRYERLVLVALFFSTRKLRMKGWSLVWFGLARKFLPFGIWPAKVMLTCQSSLLFQMTIFSVFLSYLLDVVIPDHSLTAKVFVCNFFFFFHSSKYAETACTSFLGYQTMAKRSIQSNWCFQPNSSI